MSRIFLVLTFFFLNSCQFKYGASSSVLSANIYVVVAPFGPEDKVFSDRPIIFISGGDKVCRPRLFSFREARTTLKNSGLEDEILNELFGEALAPSLNNTDSVRTSVGENWLKFGLYIENRNGGKNNNFFLVIDSISFVATATYKGQVFQHAGNVDAGYCSGEGTTSATDNGVAPYLYFIPPGQKIVYSSFSTNPFHNLTIYLDGFPIIDRYGEPTRAQQNKINQAQQYLGLARNQGRQQQNNQGGQQQNNQGGQQQNQGGQQSQGGQQNQFQDDEILVIPQYDVQLILTGYFMTKSGVQVQAFVKRAGFLTKSSIDLK